MLRKHAKLSIFTALSLKNDIIYSNLLAHVWVELLVPWRKQGSGDIQPLAIQTQLKHLRSSINPFALNVPSLRLFLELLVFKHFDSKFLSNAATQKQLASQFGVHWVRDVILT